MIVGAGPTGLSLACVLAAEGISFVLVDQLAEGANTSRAAVVHARTLEVLEELKVTDRLRAEGHVVPRFTFRDRDQVLATILFDQLPTRYPYTLMVPPAGRGASGGLHRPGDANGYVAQPRQPGGAQRCDQGDRSDPGGTSVARY